MHCDGLAKSHNNPLSGSSETHFLRSGIRRHHFRSGDLVVDGLPIVFTSNGLKGMHDIEAALALFGPIRDFVHASTNQTMLVFRFAFCSVEATNRARASLPWPPSQSASSRRWRLERPVFAWIRDVERGAHFEQPQPP
ncbi:hypothetical protein DPSP01_012384 [Paraphaeosphaeria sporulosa]